MKNLVAHSFKLFRSLHLRASLHSYSGPAKLGHFSSVSRKVQNKPKQTHSELKAIQSQDNSISVKSDAELLSMTREQTEQNALKIMEEFAHINELNSQPKVLRNILITFIRVFEYEETNRGRKFYQDHKSVIDKIYYDIRSYSAQSLMRSEEILLVYYWGKLLRDYGNEEEPAGFEYRGGMRLEKAFQWSKEPNGEQLTFDQAVSGKWLMASGKFSNHFFKWNVHRLLLNQIKHQEKKIDDSSYGSEPEAKKSLTLSNLACLLGSFYCEVTHMLTDFSTFCVIVRYLHLQKEQSYHTYEQLISEENVFIEMYTCLCAMDINHGNVQNFLQTRAVIHKMTQSIYKRLLNWFVPNQTLRKEFLQASQSLKKLTRAPAYRTYTALLQKSQANPVPLSNFTEADLYRYFILMVELYESFPNKERNPHEYEVLMFYLGQTFKQFFLPILNSKNFMTHQHLSIYARYSLILIDNQLSQVYESFKLQNSAYQNEDLQEKSAKILDKFSQIIKVLMQKKRPSRSYLDSNDPQSQQILNQQKKQLVKITNNIIKPMHDFISGLQKYNKNSFKVLVSEQQLGHIIDEFEQLATLWYGNSANETEPRSNNSVDSSTKYLSIENQYFWMLKFLRLQFSKPPQNQTHLKDFQSLLQTFVQNNTNENPQSYSPVLIYNFYAYMCQLQQKMMLNDQRNDETLTLSAFLKNPNYQYFLAYKEYLAAVIYTQNFDYQKFNQLRNTHFQILSQFQIHRLFLRNDSQNKNIKSGKNFKIYEFFDIVFKKNRFYNHKLLAEEFLVYNFGNEEVFFKSFTQNIQKNNQRTGENVGEYLYMILIAGNRNIPINLVKNTLDIADIRKRLYQALSEKSVTIFSLTLFRNYLSPRKSSFFRRNPLKYRINPISIFEAIQSEPLKRKKEVLLTVLQFMGQNIQMLSVSIQILVRNLQVWTEAESSQLVWGTLVPFLNRVIDANSGNKKTKHSASRFFNMVMRMAARSRVRIKPEHEKTFLHLVESGLMEPFQEIVKRPFGKYMYMDGQTFLAQLEFIYRLNRLSTEKLVPILIKCREIVQKAKVPQIFEAHFQSMMNTFGRLIDNPNRFSGPFNNDVDNTYYLEKEERDMVKKSGKIFTSSKKSTSSQSFQSSNKSGVSSRIQTSERPIFQSSFESLKKSNLSQNNSTGSRESPDLAKMDTSVSSAKSIWNSKVFSQSQKNQVNPSSLKKEFRSSVKKSQTQPQKDSKQKKQNQKYLSKSTTSTK